MDAVAEHSAPARLPAPGYLQDLDAAWSEAWRLLVRGVADRRSPFHIMSVATVRPDGAPSARTVVLRGADPHAATLRFHTDARAPKVSDIGGDGRVALLLYDSGRKIQVRIDGMATVHGSGALADAAWQGSRPGSRACYTQTVAPGTPLAAPAGTAPAEPGPVEAGRENFRVVEVLVNRLECLWLHSAGHRRALFDCRPGCAPEGRWIAP